jgi:hypothetical protein
VVVGRELKMIALEKELEKMIRETEKQRIQLAPEKSKSLSEPGQ